MLSKPIDLLRDRRGVYGIGISDAIDRHALAIACGYHSEARLPRALILRPDALTDPHNGSAALQKITGGFRHGPFVHCAEEHLRQVIHYRMLRTAGLPWPPQHPIRYWSADEKQQARNRQVYHGLRCGSLGIINKLIGAAIEAAADPDAIKMARRFAFSNRYAIYCAAARSRRALQLAETFPALARRIYCPNYGRPSADQQAEAMRLVERGARLRDVAALMGIPMALRRVKPGAVHFVSQQIRPDLLTHMPDSLPQMRFWLCAVHWAARNRGDLAEWVAKNAALIPGKCFDERKSFLSDLADWIFAERFVTRPFSPNMSLRTVMKLSADWHEAVANNLDGPQYSFPKPWLPATRLNGYEIVPIANGADLYREGAAMRHCVGSYGSLVTRGDCYIYSVREDGKRVATAEIIRADGRMVLGQIRGPCNAQAPKEIVAAMRRWLRAIALDMSAS
ncbi:MAG TPA: PcfJ domain-containing protein [Pseudolabrys sp.]|nr:PcfJ domain-containing protein [Pseudolabrys sp.]